MRLLESPKQIAESGAVPCPPVRWFVGELVSGGGEPGGELVGYVAVVEQLEVVQPGHVADVEEFDGRARGLCVPAVGGGARIAHEEVADEPSDATTGIGAIATAGGAATTVGAASDLKRIRTRWPFPSCSNSTTPWRSISSTSRPI